jgi:hypothetical protein
MATKPKERRAAPRVETDMAAHIICPPAKDAITVQTHNVSSAGLYCKVPKYIPPSTQMGIAMIVPVREGKTVRSELVEFMGIVVRVEPEEEEPGRKEYDIALYFHGLTDEARSLIDTYVQQHSEAKQSS